MLSKLELVEQTLYDSNIELINTSHNIKAAAIRTETSSAVFINHNLLETQAEKTTAILHEYYHLEYNAMYTFEDTLRTRKRREYKANKALIMEHIPLGPFKELIGKGYQNYEIAEEFCLTEDIVNEAYRIYKQMGVIFG